MIDRRVLVLLVLAACRGGGATPTPAPAPPPERPRPEPAAPAGEIEGYSELRQVYADDLIVMYAARDSFYNEKLIAVPAGRTAPVDEVDSLSDDTPTVTVEPFWADLHLVTLSYAWDDEDGRGTSVTYRLIRTDPDRFASTCGWQGNFDSTHVSGRHTWAKTTWRREAGDPPTIVVEYEEQNREYDGSYEKGVDRIVISADDDCERTTEIEKQDPDRDKFRGW